MAVLDTGDFSIKVNGKFILAGEHAVLRGTPALVFPVASKLLSLEFQSSDREATLETTSEASAELNLVFWGVLERALSLCERGRSDVRGEFHVDNHVPVGAGLGASAALCVAVARWVQWKGWIREKEIQEFARQMENLFHGESSGVDVAVGLSGTALFYRRGQGLETFKANWSPRWCLSYSGQKGITAESIKKVKSLWSRNEKLGRELDREMEIAVGDAVAALLKTEAAGFEGLSSAMDRARRCFERWGLVQGALEQHMTSLLADGAVAVKPTGSGGGGFVLSLWSEEPPAHRMDLIRV